MRPPRTPGHPCLSLLDRVDQVIPESRVGARVRARARVCERMIDILLDPRDPEKNKGAPPPTTVWIAVEKLRDPDRSYAIHAIQRRPSTRATPLHRRRRPRRELS
jgi:hypothetical protein